MPLTDTQIRKTKSGDKPVKLTDGKGLYLEIRPSGSRLWRYRYRISGKENIFAAGEYVVPPNAETDRDAEMRRSAGRLTLSEARIEREKWRGLVKKGVHPARQRKTERLVTTAQHANTFESVAREWKARKKPNWSAYYYKQVDRFFGQRCFSKNRCNAHT